MGQILDSFFNRRKKIRESELSDSLIFISISLGYDLFDFRSF
ncbi:hypothetical protein UNSWDHB_1062 [Dehalobacter sp. UNSWDHB]|nr:hypothetical protein DHBDCA_p766 [Dehalobacter sp. DCA]AFV04831.1 hypothetical protein DCF50_p824 [Dehalobacter sp. CF]EQB21605.1 hypothetical protein UNSWDHB_1062 [Dehalobacter sp. UNSWDHB]